MGRWFTHVISVDKSPLPESAMRALRLHSIRSCIACAAPRSFRSGIFQILREQLGEYVTRMSGNVGEWVFRRGKEFDTVPLDPRQQRVDERHALDAFMKPHKR